MVFMMVNNYDGDGGVDGNEALKYDDDDSSR